MTGSSSCGAHIVATSVPVSGAKVITLPAGSQSELQQQAEQHLLTFSRQVIFYAADGAWQTQDKAQASTAAPEGFTWEQVRAKPGCSPVLLP